jgi:hypothetical protein
MNTEINRIEAGIFRGAEEKLLVIKQTHLLLYLVHWYHLRKQGVKEGTNKFTWSPHLSVARRFFLRDRPLCVSFLDFLKTHSNIETEIITVDANRLLGLSEVLPIPPKTQIPKPATQIEWRTGRKPWSGV